MSNHESLLQRRASQLLTDEWKNKPMQSLSIHVVSDSEDEEVYRYTFVTKDGLKIYAYDTK